MKGTAPGTVPARGMGPGTGPDREAVPEIALVNGLGIVETVMVAEGAGSTALVDLATAAVEALATAARTATAARGAAMEMRMTTETRREVQVPASLAPLKMRAGNRNQGNVEAAVAAEAGTARGAGRMNKRHARSRSRSATPESTA